MKPTDTLRPYRLPPLGILLALMIPSLASAQPSAQTSFANVPIGGGGYVTGLTFHPLSGTDGRSIVLYARADVGGCLRWDTDGNWIPLMNQFGSIVMTPATTDAGYSYYSCEGMAVDPSDTSLQNVYALLGEEWPAHVMRSSDQGGTWVDTGLAESATAAHLPIPMGYGKSDYRWAGDRLAIDPNLPGLAYVGTRESGLWKNADINASTVSDGTWTQISTDDVPVGIGTGQPLNGTDKIGITFVAFDKASGGSPTKVIYVGVYGGSSSDSTDGVYESTDQGMDWEPMPGSPLDPVQGRVDANGNLYVTTGFDVATESSDGGGCGGDGPMTTYEPAPGGVYRYSDGAWADITPSSVVFPWITDAQFSGIDINPVNSQELVVAVGNAGSGAESSQVFYSSDGAHSWTSTLGYDPTPNFTETVPWQPDSYFGSNISYAIFAPETDNTHEVWFGDWYNDWSTLDIRNPAWQNNEVGFEETVGLSLRAPPPEGTDGAVVLTGVEDDDGFRNMTLAVGEFPTTDDHFTGVKDTTSIDTYEQDNNIVYRVGDSKQVSGTGYQSTDNGAHWNPFDLTSITSGTDGINPLAGRIAVSATHSNLIVWLPLAGCNANPDATHPYYSSDGGQSWTEAAGLPMENYIHNTWYSAQGLASDKVKDCFYMYEPQYGFFVSTDSASGPAGALYVTDGVDLPQIYTDSSDYETYGVKTLPGTEGAVWVYIEPAAPSGAISGLYTSTNFGTAFSPLCQPKTENPWFKSVTQMGFGAPAPGSGEPAAVYVMGQMTDDTQDWLYESNDLGYSWYCLNGIMSTDGGPTAPNPTGNVNQFGDKISSIEGDRINYGTFYFATVGAGCWYGTSTGLFDDDFQGPAQSWLTDGGTWQTVLGMDGNPGYYALTSTGGGVSYFTDSAGPSWNAYSVTATITPTTLSSDSYIELSLYDSSDGKNNYSALLYPQALDIARFSDGQEEVLAKKEIDFGTDDSYTVELAATDGSGGTELSVYLNGALEAHCSDGAYTDGTIGVGASSKAAAEFTNIHAVSLQQ